MGYFALAAPAKKAVLHFGLIALFFSWLGDVFLIFQHRNSLYFMLGLGAFLIAHLTYVYTYKKARIEGVETHGLLSTQRIRYTFMLILAGLGLVYVLFPYLGDMMIPVIVYASVIVLMAIYALNRFGKTSLSSFFLVFLGAIVFMVSDSTLAINKFMQPIPYAGVWIMLTYILAQYLIVEGLLKHMEKALLNQ